MGNGITLDTLAISKRLEKEGNFTREQAEAITSAVNEATSGKLDKDTLNSFVNKADMVVFESVFKADFTRLESVTKSEISRLEAATKADIIELRSATKADIAQTEARIGRWFIATTLTIIGVIIALAVGAATVLAPYLNILFRLGSLATG